MSENRVIGKDGALPWHLPTDLKYFKRLTTGHTIIMGRKTLDSVGRALPDRRTIVVTRNAHYECKGVETTTSLERALQLTVEEEEVFVVGGGDIYRLALPRADRIYLTFVHSKFDGDTFFPEIDPSCWTLTQDDRHEPDDKHRYPYSFRLYERIEK